ncbi:V-type proton ATPase proteolipid subunit [Thecamonas trahens ATCC 50062]|uniref:V-type proton ATPase proteolipid subunit n=1 Tax=Thecamonas trahens ATCC 50062 TaxID=461836 RepID=A0A0L0D7D0_THETB|nr:V-type proton ATPase proteolipid subunit [Thecamonas trahens ATCC 50062]KNC47996.1 V-type proton ATPase proteolipid subunit [Thecamonas trahens ATCC 50062]|eukprot:XP_013759013.1 V-type proton ATPase proteolipid subunit [Thecamonas trahens ATCC 50062]
MASLPEIACDPSAPFFGSMGAAAAISLGCLGAAYGTAKSSIGISAVGVLKPELIMRSIIPVVMAGIVGIYGLIVSIIISTSMKPATYPDASGYIDLGAGLAVGLAGLASGMCIGIVGDSGVRAFAQQPRVYVTLILILIFAEALGLYGLIVAIVMGGQKPQTGSFKCVTSN